MANPEIEALRAMFAAMPKDLGVAELRAAYDGIGGQFPPPADALVREAEIPGVRAEWTQTPGAREDRTLLYLHGGGYVIGSLASHRHLVIALGRAAGMRTLAVDYRLAPEHPFPAAVDDAVAAYRHLLEAGAAPGTLALAGDSAGGGLVVALLLALKAQGLPQPACAVCISPWVDMEALGGSMVSKAGEDPMVQREGLLAWASAYLGGRSAKEPLAAPIHGDLRGLAPLLIQVGSAETLLDDALALAGAAGAAEVEVELEIWPEMLHVWHFFHPVLAEGRRAIARAGAYLSMRVGAG